MSTDDVKAREIPKVEVQEGTICVESIHGVFYDNAFVLYVSLREKYVGVFAYNCTPPCVLLTPGERTLRGGEALDLSVETPTDIRIDLPGEWVIEASGGRYTCEIVGVQRPEIDPEKHSVPFVVSKEGVT